MLNLVVHLTHITVENQALQVPALGNSALHQMITYGLLQEAVAVVVIVNAEGKNAVSVGIQDMLISSKRLVVTSSAIGQLIKYVVLLQVMVLHLIVNQDSQLHMITS